MANEILYQCSNGGECKGWGRCRYTEPEMTCYPKGFEWRGKEVEQK